MIIELHEISCYKCGISFWITENHNKRLLKSKDGFWCPGGHEQAYVGDTEAQRLQKIISQKNTEIWQLEDKLKKAKRKPRVNKKT